MFNLFKKKKSQQEKVPQQMECPKCYVPATAEAAEKVEAVKKSLGL